MNLRNLINFVFFNVVWFSCVLGAAHDRMWIGLLALAVFAGWQLAVSEDHVGDIRLLGAAALIGWIVDTLYVQTGLLRYASPLPTPEIAPWWIVALWLNFALIINHSLRWLQSTPLLAGALGLVGGPLAYYGGMELDAVFPLYPTAGTLAVIGVVWALVTPLLFGIARLTRVPEVEAEPVHLKDR